MEEVAFPSARRRAGLGRVSIRAAEREPAFAVAWGVYTVWSRMSRDGLPADRALDPLAFGPRALAHMALMDVLAEGKDVRWRLCGERVGDLLGLRLTGRRLSEVAPQLGPGAQLAGLIEQVVRYRAPRFYRLDLQGPPGESGPIHGVLLPLRRLPGSADAPAPVATILGACDVADP